MAEIRIHNSYSAIDPAEWDALVGDESPFLESTFLFDAERLGCAVPKTGWLPRPICVHDDDGTLVAGAPGWVKTHSMGEFVYDHSWADAAYRAGFEYYPKLVIAVPFTPVTGARLLVRPGHERRRWLPALLEGMKVARDGTHGLHVLFDSDSESEWLEDRGGMRRAQFQFHWFNEGYATFDDFLARFKSKKRNKIRRERRDVHADYDVEVIVGPSEEVLDALHGFYADTCRGFGPWGRVYLSKPFFRHLGENWGERLHTVIARDKGTGRIVGGTFNILKGDRLYGRYWGAHDRHSFLHFELCYYMPIQDCIERGLQVFEPGHGGSQKYKRGFVPHITWSNHWLGDRRLHDALADYTAQELDAVRLRVAALKKLSPLR